MASSQTLSAVARRKATQLENSTIYGSKSDPDDISAMNGSSANTLLAIPLKRKTSAVSIKEPDELSTSFKTEKLTRKKSKAERHIISRQASTSSTPQRAYSPSQPIIDSSDEDQSPPSLDNPKFSEVGVYQEPGNVTDCRTHRNPKIPGTIFNPVDGQNLFSVSAQQALPFTAKSTSAHILTMQPGESLIFVGVMQFILLQGAVELMGASLLPSKTIHRVFAPRSHPIATISVLLTHDTVSVPSIPQLLKQLPQHIQSPVATAHSVIFVQEFTSGIDGLGQVLRPFGNLFEPDTRDKEVTHRIAKGMYILKSEPKFDSLFYLPEDWRLALDGIVPSPSGVSDKHENDAPIVLVRGGKNTGKSTFSKTLANRLLNNYRRVAFVECDLGQSEFTPGGMVSLNVLTTPVFGPSFTHLSTPRRAHFIGGTSPKTSPSHYLSALNDLSQQYQLELKYSTAFDEHLIHGPGGNSQSKISTVIPLVINTQGWVKGMGADLLRSIETMFEPSHIIDFQVSGTISKLNIPSPPRTFVGEPLSSVRTNDSSVQISVAAIPPPLYPPRFSASDLRNLTLMSYFHGRFPPRNLLDLTDGCIDYWDTSLPLRGVAPIVVDINMVFESITITAPGGEDVIPAELSKALVCGLVGLVAPELPTARSGEVYIQGGLPPSPQTSQCVGLAFIRGVSDTKIQLLTPTPVRELGACRDLVLGELSMPIWAFLDSAGDGQGEIELPFLQWGRSIAESAGGERKRVRRNIMRRSQA